MTGPDATPPPMHSCTLDIAREGNARWDALRIADRYATDNATLRDRIAELETDRARLRRLLELRGLDPDEQPPRTPGPSTPLHPLAAYQRGPRA